MAKVLTFGADLVEVLAGRRPAQRPRWSDRARVGAFEGAAGSPTAGGFGALPGEALPGTGRVGRRGIVIHGKCSPLLAGAVIPMLAVGRVLSPSPRLDRSDSDVGGWISRSWRVGARSTFAISGSGDAPRDGATRAARVRPRCQAVPVIPGVSLFGGG
jgi:hypothetical protein